MGLAAEAAPTATKRGQVHLPRSDFGRPRGPTCMDRCMNVSIRWRNRPLPPMHVLSIAQGAVRRYRVVPRAPLIRPSTTFSPLRGEKRCLAGGGYSIEVSVVGRVLRTTKKPKHALRLYLYRMVEQKPKNANRSLGLNWGRAELCCLDGRSAEQCVSSFI